MKIKNPFKMPNFLILSPIILVMFLDAVFTLIGQPEKYWQNFKFFNEVSPLGQQILMTHPILFVLSFVFYIPFVMFLIINFKRPFNIIIALSFFLGHVWGSVSWLPKIFSDLININFLNSWYLSIGYFVFIALFSGFCINLWLKRIKIVKI